MHRAQLGPLGLPRKLRWHDMQRLVILRILDGLHLSHGAWGHCRQGCWHRHWRLHKWHWLHWWHWWGRRHGCFIHDGALLVLRSCFQGSRLLGFPCSQEVGSTSYAKDCTHHARDSKEPQEEGGCITAFGHRRSSSNQCLVLASQAISIMQILGSRLAHIGDGNGARASETGCGGGTKSGPTDGHWIVPDLRISIWNEPAATWPSWESSSPSWAEQRIKLTSTVQVPNKNSIRLFHIFEFRSIGCNYLYRSSCLTPKFVNGHLSRSPHQGDMHNDINLQSNFKFIYFYRTNASVNSHISISLPIHIHITIYIYYSSISRFKVPKIQRIGSTNKYQWECGRGRERPFSGVVSPFQVNFLHVGFAAQLCWQDIALITYLVGRDLRWTGNWPKPADSLVAVLVSMDCSWFERENTCVLRVTPYQLTIYLI